RIVLKRLLAIVSWAALELREAPAGRVAAAIELRPRLVEATAGVGVVGVPRGVRPFVAFEQPLELLRGAFEFSSAATSLVDRSWVDGGHDLAHARTDETLDGPRIAGIDACRGGREFQCREALPELRRRTLGAPSGVRIRQPSRCLGLLFTAEQAVRLLPDTPGLGGQAPGLYRRLRRSGENEDQDRGCNACEMPGRSGSHGPSSSTDQA